MKKKYNDYILKQLEKLISIDSPGAFTDMCGDYVEEELIKLGFAPKRTNKGGVLANLGGEGNGLLMEGHIDTLGAMVRDIKPNGRLKLYGIGGLNCNSLETEWVRIYTRDGRTYGGTIQLCNASTHANGEARTAPRNLETIEVLLDENVSSKAEVEKLGIEKGNVVAVSPRFSLTDSGYIKSRYLDDKLVVAIVLGFAKYIKEEKIELCRNVWMHFSVFEEIGHGAGGICPEGCTEVLALDMGTVGDCTDGSEKKVSICIGDLSGPYNVRMTTDLVNAAKRAKVDYSVDVYPNYSSDASEAVNQFDLRHALIGPGVYASHGYERSHVDSIKNTFDLLEEYLKKI